MGNFFISWAGLRVWGWIKSSRPIVYAFRCLPHMSITSSKASSPQSPSSCNSPYPLVSFRLSSSCLLLLPRLPITCNFPLSFHSVTCNRRPVSTQDVTNAISIFLSSFSYNFQYREDSQQLREKAESTTTTGSWTLMLNTNYVTSCNGNI